MPMKTNSPLRGFARNSPKKVFARKNGFQLNAPFHCTGCNEEISDVNENGIFHCLCAYVWEFDHQDGRWFRRV